MSEENKYKPQQGSKYKKKQNRYLKPFKEWLGVKSIFLAIGIGIIIVLSVSEYLLTIPFLVHNFLDIGYIGVLIGGVLLFIIFNIPIGVFSVLVGLGEDELFPVETVCVLIVVVICLATLIYIYGSGAILP